LGGKGFGLVSGDFHLSSGYLVLVGLLGFQWKQLSKYHSLTKVSHARILPEADLCVQQSEFGHARLKSSSKYKKFRREKFTGHHRVKFLDNILPSRGSKKSFKCEINGKRDSRGESR
jgi:hypothetical protein